MATILIIDDEEGLRGTRPLAVAPQGKQVADLLDREAQVPGTPDEPKGTGFPFRVHPIPRPRTVGFRYQADAFVVPDHLGRDT